MQCKKTELLFNKALYFSRNNNEVKVYNVHKKHKYFKKQQVLPRFRQKLSLSLHKNDKDVYVRGSEYCGTNWSVQTFVQDADEEKVIRILFLIFNKVNGMKTLAYGSNTACELIFIKVKYDF